MYKNYIFDLYGTLIDINTDEENDILWSKLALFYSFKGASYSGDEISNSYKTLVKQELEKHNETTNPDIKLEDVFTTLYTNKNVTPSDQLIEDTAQLFRTLSIKYIKLFDNAKELLQGLKASGGKVYLLSNAQRIFTYYEMKFLGIVDYFDDIFISSDCYMCKPDVNFFNKLIDKHNLDKSETIMIGNDCISDIEGAYNAGIDSFYIHSNQSREIEKPLLSKFTLMEMDLDKVKNMLLEK